MRKTIDTTSKRLSSRLTPARLARSFAGVLLWLEVSSLLWRYIGCPGHCYTSELSNKRKEVLVTNRVLTTGGCTKAVTKAFSVSGIAIEPTLQVLSRRIPQALYGLNRCKFFFKIQIHRSLFSSSVNLLIGRLLV